MSNTHSGTPTIDDQTAETPLADLCHVGGQDFSDLCEDIFTLCGKRLTLSALKNHKKEKFIEMKAHNNNETMEFLCMWIDEYELDRWFKQDAKKDKEELHGEYHLEGHPKKYFGPDFDPRKDYKKDASSFSPDSPDELVGRTGDFSLVCGPSGSGKSVFCLRHFGVHFFGDNTFTCMAKMSDYNFSQESRQGSLEVMVQGLKKIFDEYTHSYPMKDICLCIVFDEAGVSNGKHFFDHGKTPNMAWFLDAMKEVCEEVHIVFTGTNLDDITQEVDSDTPFVKVRMQRWTVDKFQSLDTRNIKKKAAIVRKWPILQALITNARCACYVDKTLGPYACYDGTIDHYGFITSVVHSVVHSYKRINALVAVKERNEMLTIAMYVCKLLDIEKQNFQVIQKGQDNEQIQMPNFGIIKDKSTRKKVRAFFDVNIQVQGGTHQRVDKNLPSLSISPALTILLAVFLGGHASFGFDLQHFEHNVMIGEILNFLRQLDNNPITAKNAEKYRFFVLDKAVPGTSSDYLTVPRQINTGSVFINKSKANFADGFTLVKDGIRFFQAKFGEKKKVTLNLLEELHKTGLLETSPKDKKAVVSYMLKHRDDHCQTDDQSKELDQSDDAENKRSFYNHTYPLSQICQNMAQKEQLTKQIKLSEQSSDENEEKTQKKLYAVFATNCPTFHIPRLSDFSNIKKKETILKRFEILGFDLMLKSHENNNEIECLKNELKSLMEKFESVDLNNSTNDEKLASELRSNLTISEDIGSSNHFKSAYISQNDVDFNGMLKKNKSIPSYISKRLRKNVELRFDFYCQQQEDSEG